MLFISHLLLRLYIIMLLWARIKKKKKMLRAKTRNFLNLMKVVFFNVCSYECDSCILKCPAGLTFLLLLWFHMWNKWELFFLFHDLIIAAWKPVISPHERDYLFTLREKWCDKILHQYSSTSTPIFKELFYVQWLILSIFFASKNHVFRYDPLKF